MKKKPLIEKIFDAIGCVCIVIFFGAIILKIWLNKESQILLNNIWQTSLIVFVFLFIFYVFITEQPKKSKKKKSYENIRITTNPKA